MQITDERRFWICIFILAVTEATAPAATLTWTAGQSREWNTVHSNWGGGLLFQSGDIVRFPSGVNNVFIGLDGVPDSVSPASIILQGQYTFSGGDIRTGPISNDGGSLSFTNYAEGLSFPGGLLMRLPANRLTYEVRRAPNSARLGLGSGAINFAPDCIFSVQVGHAKGIELANNLFFNDRCQLLIEPFYQQTNGTVRFTGSVFLNGFLTIDNSGGNFGRPPGVPGPFPDAFAGQLVLWQENTRQLMLNLNGWYGHRPFEISGDIVDGTGTASNRLEFQNYGMFVFRITGANNTYGHGTYVRSSPSAPRAAIEVAPGSSLGTGDVLVEGLLRLRGNKNIHSNATVRVQQGGQVMLDPGVIVRVKSLQLGTTTYTSGRFTSNNAPNAILGAGEFRVGTNAWPTITVIQPPPSVYAGSDITFQAIPDDPDGRISKVAFTFYEAVMIMETTNAPWSVTLTNWGYDVWYSFAWAFDDEGAYYPAALSEVRVLQPPAPQLRNPRLAGTNAFLFDFDAISGVKYSVETRNDLSASAWERGAPFQTSGTLTVTNPIPTAPNQRFFRIRAGQQ